MSKARGAGRLAVEATLGVLELVETLHRTIASGPAVLGRPLERPASLVTGAVYGTIRGVTRLVGDGVDAALAQLEPLLGEGQSPALVAALNGVLGDSLHDTHNPLAIAMSLRSSPPATSRVVVLVHGSSMNDRQWNRNGHDHGAALARDLGFTPVYAHYNSGLHVSVNGRELSTQLEALLAAWPVPVDELVLIGHSMGGLVARSACHAGAAAAWRRKLRALITLGTPHHGSPLERAGNWFELLLGVSRYSAPFKRLATLRSAGVTDLRFGNVLDEHWQGRDRFDLETDARVPLPLPDDVACYAIAATRSEALNDSPHGDGLVPVDSALGRHSRPELTLAFPPDHQWVGVGMGHLDLLDRRDVYETLRAWLSARSD